jgi:hypothetical protein
MKRFSFLLCFAVLVTSANLVAAELTRSVESDNINTIAKAPIPTIEQVAGTYFVGENSHPLIPIFSDFYIKLDADGSGKSSYAAGDSWRSLRWKISNSGQVVLIYDDPASIYAGPKPTKNLTDDQAVLADCSNEVHVNLVTEGHTFKLKESMSNKVAVSWSDLDYYRPVESVNCTKGKTAQMRVKKFIDLDFELVKSTARSFLSWSDKRILGRWILPVTEKFAGKQLSEVVFHNDNSLEVIDTEETAAWSLSDDGKELIIEFESGIQKLAIFDEANGFLSVRNRYTSKSGETAIDFNYGYRIKDKASTMTLYTQGDKYYTSLAYRNQSRLYDYSRQELKHFSSNQNILLSKEPKALIITDWDKEKHRFKAQKLTQWKKRGTRKFAVNLTPDTCSTLDCYTEFTILDVTDSGDLIFVNFGRLDKFILRALPETLE